MTPANTATYAIERGWTDAGSDDLAKAIVGVISGYGSELLTEDELLGVVTGKFGDLAADRFVDLLSRGFEIRPGVGVQRSFVGMCVWFQRFDFLSRMVDDANDRQAFTGGRFLTKAQWLERLSGRFISTGVHVVYSIYMHADDLAKSSSAAARTAARSAFAFALEHAPDHEDRSTISARSELGAALMTEHALASALNDCDFRPNPAAPSLCDPLVPFSNRRAKQL